MQKFKKLIRDTQGATAIEYGLIVALIALSILAAMQGMGGQLKTTFNTTSSHLRTNSA